jgi:acetyl esterase/lipase
MLRTLTIAFILTALPCLAQTKSVQQKPIEINVWPDQAPDEVGQIGEETHNKRAGENPSTLRISNVTKPTLSYFPAAVETANGTAVLVCPGGGLNILAWDKEGTEVAEWLNSLGVTAFVLKYRVPARQKNERWLHALQDCQRAMSLLRTKVNDFDTKIERIGILGFSAGGFLSAMTSTSFNDRQYAPIDKVDEAKSRPDFAVLVYPAYLVNKENKLESHVKVTDKTPPMFFAHAWDDRVRPESSLQLFTALRQRKIPAELHIFDAGGHGFGLRKSDSPASHWPELCGRWMTRNGWLGPKK